MFRMCVCLFIYFLFRSLTTLVITLFSYSFIYLFIFGYAGYSLLQRLFSHFGEQGYSLVSAGRLLVAMSSLVAERRLQWLWHLGSEAAAPRLHSSFQHRLHTCDAWA